eukprot:1202947-Prymnesium_polylepis.2
MIAIGKCAGGGWAGGGGADGAGPADTAVAYVEHPIHPLSFTAFSWSCAGAWTWRLPRAYVFLPGH